MENLILVNELDQEIGTGPKLEVHERGQLHRAFSIFVFDRARRLLLQRRARSKYHSGGLWSNTCCGHPRPGESTEDAAHRRLIEEMNFDCGFGFRSSFVYRAAVDHNLTEWEFDHVFVGVHDRDPIPDAGEVEDWRWMDLEELNGRIQHAPARYTTWLKIALAKFDMGDVLRGKLR